MTSYRDIVAKPNNRDRCVNAGWRLDEHCTCEKPRPALVGGDGYWCVPIMCTECRRVAP